MDPQLETVFPLVVFVIMVGVLGVVIWLASRIKKRKARWDQSGTKRPVAPERVKRPEPGGPDLAWARRRLAELRDLLPDRERVRLVRRNFWLYSDMPAQLQSELMARAALLLEVMEFKGADGLAVTQEMRVTIAALASLLLLGREMPLYPGVHTVVIHPEWITRKDEVIGGFASDWGVVNVAWHATSEGRHDSPDGYGIVVHEFAHQLDFEDEVGREAPQTLGIPVMPSAVASDDEALRRWLQVMERELDQLIQDVAARRSTVLSEYGARDMREFFAVATETFFELPGQLREDRPELYEAMRTCYRLDPATWTRP